MHPLRKKHVARTAALGWTPLTIGDSISRVVLSTTLSSPYYSLSLSLSLKKPIRERIGGSGQGW